MWDLYEKNKDIILYVFFGICTTVINVLLYAVFARQMHLGTMVSTVLAWVLAVLFAYITNRRWVFKSKAHSVKEIVVEVWAFFLCRIATGMLDWAMMFVFVEKFLLNDVFIKMIANMAVIVLNYIGSKCVIFKKK